MKNTIAFKDNYGNIKERVVTGRWINRESTLFHYDYYIIDVEVYNKWFGTSWIPEYSIIEINDCKQ